MLKGSEELKGCVLPSLLENNKGRKTNISWSICSHLNLKFLWQLGVKYHEITVLLTVVSSIVWQPTMWPYCLTSSWVLVFFRERGGGGLNILYGNWQPQILHFLSPLFTPNYIGFKGFVKLFMSLSKTIWGFFYFSIFMGKYVAINLRLLKRKKTDD